ncbi:MAG TPA: chemotaxis protein CheA [Verrucomicrobiae bacterium]
MTDLPVALGRLADQIALELAFAEPGKDNGLLPINSMLGQVEDLLAETPDATVTEGLVFAREVLDRTFLESGLFTTEVLAQLNLWTQWLQMAAKALEAATKPAAWGVPGEISCKKESPPANPASPTGDEFIEEALTLNLENDAELLREFINESHEHLQNIELGVLTLEEHPTDGDTLNSIFRAFHTFKGGSGFLNLRPINKLAHELESLLDLARQHKLAITAPVINLILSGGDTLKRFVQQIDAQISGNAPETPVVIPIGGLLARIKAVIEEGGKAEAMAPVVEERAVIAPVGTAQAIQADNATASETTPKAGMSASFVKVDTVKLDSLVDLVGEMVIAQCMVAQDKEIVRNANPLLTRNLAQLGRITRELQRTAMSLRMMPIRSTFQKMTRLVRDLSQKAGKQVELHLSGEDTELDRTIVEEISDPLIHMVRNAVDHGIERAEKRMAQGKAPFGKVWLRAYHKGGSIVIEIKDDGAGLNAERIKQKGIEKGLLAPDANPTDKEIFNLIFAPGFSTAEKITDISGRGVGMDVVRRNIEHLRGRVEIESVPGQGTTFAIYLPLTLAIIDGLLVSVGTEKFILPTLSVRESFRPAPQMISSVQERGEMVNVRGRLLPLLRLNRHFNITTKASRAEEGVIVVLEADNESRCVLVDELLGKQEVVIKTLGSMFKESLSLAGAAILGDGRVGLILDVNHLVKLEADVLSRAA